MKVELKKDMSLHIPLQGFGYLHLEPLAKTSDDQHWGLMLKIGDGMCISGKSIAATSLEEVFKAELLNALQTMKLTLENIREEIKKGNLI